MDPVQRSFLPVEDGGTLPVVDHLTFDVKIDIIVISKLEIRSLMLYIFIYSVICIYVYIYILLLLVDIS